MKKSACHEIDFFLSRNRIFQKNSVTKYRDKSVSRVFSRPKSNFSLFFWIKLFCACNFVFVFDLKIWLFCSTKLHTSMYPGIFFFLNFFVFFFFLFSFLFVDESSSSSPFSSSYCAFYQQNISPTNSTHRRKLPKKELHFCGSNRAQGGRLFA